MEDIFYQKYKNLHITNNINIINPYELNPGDKINILSGNEDITQKTLKFKKIEKDNIINFSINNNNKKYYSYGFLQNEEEDIYSYYENNNYFNIYEVNEYLSPMFKKYIIKKSKNNTNKKYISGIFIDSETDIYSYLIFPASENYIKILINVGLTPKHDLLLYLNMMDDIGYFNLKMFKINGYELLDNLKSKNESFNWYKKMLFCKNYTTSKYIYDNNRENTLKDINKFLMENYNYTFNPKLCFENVKLNLKSYSENNVVIISHNDKIINFSSGKYIHDFYENYEEGCVIKQRPIEYYSDNIEFQENYRIAYAMANFANKRTGINPETGEFELKGKVNNRYILYKDYNYIITDNCRSLSYFEKIHGKYINTIDEEKIKLINENYDVLKTLTN